MSQDTVRQRLLPIHASFHKGNYEACEECKVLLKEFGRELSGGTDTVKEPAPSYAPRRMGRPPLTMPEPIDATPEEIARKVMNTPPPKDGWKYMKNHKARRRR